MMTGKLHFYDNTKRNRRRLFVAPAQAPLQEMDITKPFVVLKQLRPNEFLILTPDGCVVSLTLPDPENIKVWNGNDQF